MQHLIQLHFSSLTSAQDASVVFTM